MKSQPYIGITGFTSSEELRTARNIVSQIDMGDYKVMAGIITSPSTLTSGRSRIRVGMKELVEVTRSMPKEFIGAIHHHTHDENSLEDELDILLEASHGTRLVQINNTWPSPKIMQRLQNTYIGLSFVLQFNPGMLEQGLEAMATRAKEYYGLASHTLVDASQGNGIAMNPVYGAEIMNAVRDSLPDALMGIAGGLSGENVEEQVTKVREGYKEKFVIDAEGRLRTENHEGLVPGKEEAYLREGIAALK